MKEYLDKLHDQTNDMQMMLDAERSTLQTMFDSVPDLIFCKDLNLVHSHCNKSLLKYFGLTEEEFIGKDDRTSLGFSEEMAESLDYMDRMVINERKEYRYEEYLTAHDGSKRLFEASKVPLIQGDKIIGIMGIARDITERKAMEEAAKSANKAKSTFLSTMSHEVRTPINAIMGITEMHLLNEDLDPFIKEALEKIYISGDLLLSIVNDILDFSKVESGKMEIINEKYEIAGMIRDAALLNMMRIEKKPIKFLISVDDKIPAALNGDELRIKQILNNLLSNAFKYTSEGEVSLSISAYPLHNTNMPNANLHNANKVMLSLSVSDTGQGMSQEQIDRLFDEYSRFNMETNKSTEGTGLGMSITQNLIGLMDGEMIITSKPGKGSIFTVNIPQEVCGKETIGKDLAESLCEFRSDSSALMKRMQISREPMPYGSVLVADDVGTNIYVAKGLLSTYGLKIDSVESGYEVIRKIKEGNEYDIIFMDHMMPDIDGIEVVKIIRYMGYTKPIVALTANAVAGQADMYLANGFDGFISKPIDVRKLNNVLNELIRDKQQPAIQPSRGLTNLIANPGFIEIFLDDVNGSLEDISDFIEKDEFNNKDKMQMFIINIHGIKSALANIGEMELNAVAAKLEKAGRAGNHKLIKTETPAFIEAMYAFMTKLLSLKEERADDEIEDDLQYLNDKLYGIKIACEVYDENTADKILEDLRKIRWSKDTEELLRRIAKKLLHSEFEEIMDIIEKYSMKSTLYLKRSLLCATR